MRVGIIGLGSIGEVIIESFEKFSFGVSILASVRTVQRLNNLKLTQKYKNIFLTTDNLAVVKDIDQLYLCVKPLQAKEICREIKDKISEDVTIISVMAGIPLEILQEWLGTTRVMKIMPTVTIMYNGPVVVYDPHKLNPQLPFFPLFNIDTEVELDNFTGESGCVPGFLSFIFEEWVEALISLGIDSSLAEKIFIQNLIAYAQTIDNQPTRDRLAEIRDHVTSKAGATERGLDVLRTAHLSELFKRAIVAANDRVDVVKTLI